MALPFVTEELLFWDLADSLSGQPEQDSVPIPRELQELEKLSRFDRKKMLEANPLEAHALVNGWISQAEFLEKMYLDQYLAFTAEPEEIEAALEALNSKFTLLKSVAVTSLLEKPRRALKRIALAAQLQKKLQEAGLDSPWPPLVLLEHKISLSRISPIPGLEGLDERTKAQAILANMILEKFPGKLAAIRDLAVLPGGLGRIRLVDSPRSLPSSCAGMKIRSSNDLTEIRILIPGIVVEIPNQRNIGRPPPELMCPPLASYFQSPELLKLWNALEKKGEGWNDAPYALRTLGWALAIGSGQPAPATALQPAPATALQPAPAAALQPAPAAALQPAPAAALQPPVAKPQRAKEIQAPIPSPRQHSPAVQASPAPPPPAVAPTQADSITLLKESFALLGHEFILLKNELNRFLSQADQSSIVLKSMLPGLLASLLAAARSNPNSAQLLEKTCLALADLLGEKGIALLPPVPTFQPVDAASLEGAPNLELLPRFTDQGRAPVGLATLEIIGFTDGNETQKAYYFRSVGAYPTGLKETLEVLNQDAGYGRGIARALENLAAEKDNLEFASTRLFSELHGAEGKQLENANPALFKTLLEKFESYLRKNFEIKSFDPVRIADLPDNFIEVAKGARVVKGTIRRVVRPGLWDNERRLRLPALVEMD